MAASFDKKLAQLRLQHQIYNLLQEDNGVSSHFDYHVNLMSDTETIKLNLLTYNERHNEYMLFHTVYGRSSIDCLKKMLDYIQQRYQPEEHSYTIRWTKVGDTTEHLSYFMAENEGEAVAKFLHEKDPNDYSYTCSLNPVS